MWHPAHLEVCMLTRHLALGLLTVAGLTPFAAAQCGPFFANPVVIRSLPITPSQMQVIDIGGNSAPELIYAARSGTSAGISIVDLAVLNQTQVIQTLPLSVADTSVSFRVADVNRDGLLDLLVTQYSTGSIRVYLGLGDGTVNPSPAAFAAGNTPSAFVCADLNNDGKLDLVATNFSDATYSVLMGNGDGTFQPRVVAATGLARPAQIALADMNNDGRLDLVIGASPYAFAVAFGNGNGTFGTPVVYPSILFQSNAAMQLFVTDINADSVPDVVASGGGDESVLVMLGRPNGTLGNEFTVSIPLNTPRIRALTIEDFNLDGKPDIAVIQGDSGAVSYATTMLNTGNATFAAPVPWGGVNLSGGTTATTAGDINRDGLLDIVSVDRYGQLIAMNSTSGGPVQLIYTPADLVFAPGTSAATSLTVAGAGLQFEWFKRDKPLLNTDRFYGAGPNLVINDARESDSGVYQCRIFNACNSVTTALYLHVLPPSSVCPVDFNEDGFLTFEDFDAFVEAFEEGC